MKVLRRHDWQVTTTRALEIQRELAAEISRSGEVIEPGLIAGVDISVAREAGTGTAAIVVLSYPELEVVEVKTVTQKIEFPYVPGLLSFRESPLVLSACEALTVVPDLLMVDGQGIAHPRRMGLASHLGLFLEIPTIGCAKSRLCGAFEEPGNEPGNYTELLDDGEVIGMVLRTRAGVKPLYISIGHKIDLPSAVCWVTACCRGYRLPEPTRLAHQAAGGHLEPKTHATVTKDYQRRLF